MLAEARTRIVRYTREQVEDDPEVLLVDPTSERRDDELVGRCLCLVCRQGYSSSLAAASLVELGVDAGDLIGGYEGW